MLTTPPTDEGSSLGTAESSIQAPPSADETSLMNDNDDWGVVTEGKSGVLILEGEESPDLLHEGDVLSVPGADSLPTIVGSIDALPSTTEVDNNDDGVAAEESNAATPPSDFQEKTPIKAYALPNTKVLLLLLISSALLLVVTTIGYVSQRTRIQSLQKKVGNQELEMLWLENTYDELEEENARLFSQIDTLSLRNEELVVSLQEEMAELQRENERLKKGGEEEPLRWDDCKGDGAVLVDNCWVKADVQLGDCAKDAKDSVKDSFTTLLNQFLNSTAPFAATGTAQETEKDGDAESSPQDEFEVTVTKLMNKMDSLGKDVGSKMDSLGKSLWKSIESSTSAESNKVNELLSKMDDKAKTWMKEFLNGEGNNSKDSSAEENKSKESSAGLDEAVKRLAQMMNAGESVMDRAVEYATEVLEMNETEILEKVGEMLSDVSLNQHVTTEEK